VTEFFETPCTGPCADRAKAMQNLIPVIETDRLILRAPVIEDFQDFAALLMGPQGKTYGDPKTREEAWQIFLQVTGTWYLRGHGTWVITSKNGETLGLVQLGAEPGDEAPELGYILTEAAQGHGYATEAARAVRDHAMGAMHLDPVYSYVASNNAASQAVIRRLGGVDDTPEGWPHKNTIRFRHVMEAHP